MTRKVLGAALLVTVLALSFGARADKGVLGDPPVLDPALLPAEGAKAWSDGFNAVYVELLANLKEPAPPFTTRYAQPGPAWPDQVFLWDTAFIAEVWRLWDVATAQEITLAVLDNGRDGMLQHQFGPGKKSRDTQPPVMAWEVWRLYKAGHDRAYLEHAYEKLVEYNQWLYVHRQHPSGLFCWDNPFESGMDNSPRFTNRSATLSPHVKRLAAIDLSSYVYLQDRTLMRMAKELGRTGEEAAFRRKAEALKSYINRNLWSEQDGIYYDRDMKTGEFVQIKSIAGLIPLFCGVPDLARARRLRDHIMDPAEFNTRMPLPSVALNEPSFYLDMWRGPVWINTSYMVIHGLESYGFKQEARDLAFRTVDMVYKNHEATGEFLEFFDPEQIGVDRLHRKTGFGPKDEPRDKPRPHFVGWTGLVNNLVLEHLQGGG